MKQANRRCCSHWRWSPGASSNRWRLPECKPADDKKMTRKNQGKEAQTTEGKKRPRRRMTRKTDVISFLANEPRAPGRGFFSLPENPRGPAASVLRATMAFRTLLSWAFVSIRPASIPRTLESIRL